MLCGQQPFENENVAKLINQITKGDYSLLGPTFSNVSYEIKDLINKILTVDPVARLSAT